MITIIHGDDIATSRKYYLELKQQIQNPMSFDGEKINLTNLTQIFEGGGLFSDNKNIFIDNFLTKRKKSHELEEIISYMEKNSGLNEVVFWEGKEIPKKSLALFSSPSVKLFKLPQNIFIFMDNIKPQNRNQLLLFHNALENIEAELIFYMLVRQFRLLLAISDSSAGQIDEVLRLSPWQKSKLKKQACLFSPVELNNIYKKLYEIDLKQKTGNLNQTLEQAIDILLLDI